MSVGVSSFEPHDRRCIDNALESADAELYRQKRLKVRCSQFRDPNPFPAPMGESI
jgi:PleD family two-component response regulator